MAKCIGNNQFEIVPYECPPIKNITCSNGKKPILVYDKCCQVYACDCECEGWEGHYITFDGFYYTHQGQCTYVLMEEIKKHNLRIYIDNSFCDSTEDVSFFKLTNHNLTGRVDLEALKNGERLKLPYSQHSLKIINSGSDLFLEIPQQEVIIKFGRSGFRVTLPYFGNNTQGHCGTCNNNQADDCMLPNGQLVKSCAMMAENWLAKDIGQHKCTASLIVPTSEPIPCMTDSMCELLKSSLFAECHPFISPENFYKGCIFDSCYFNKTEVLCTSLQTYAAACAQAGVCIYWRNHTKTEKWSNDCPSSQIYMPCGPADHPYEPSMNVTTEGCFCPEGMILFSKMSKKCVKTCGCLDPEGNPREFNERFELTCQNCTCEESTKTVTCKPKECPEPNITKCSGDEFVLVNQTDPSDPCCYTPVCQCKPGNCTDIVVTCSIGEKSVFSVPPGKCCPEVECVPKKVCVHNGTEYQPGSSVPGSVCQDCTCVAEQNSTAVKIICEDKQCKKSCDMGFKYVRNDSHECCGKCVQTHCVVSVNGNNQLLTVKIWSPPRNKCDEYTCVKNGEILTTSISHTVCSVFNQSNCEPGTIQTTANGCCKICVEKEKACKLMPMKTNITYNKCQSVQEVDMPYCEGSCNTYTRYSEAAAEMKFSNRTVDLLCLNGDRVPYTYVHVEQCGCTHTDCTTAAGHVRKKRSFTLL
uniref:Zmp:0000001332 n=1 Tax=Amphilophus citrinellus TaxID=61819 RepID=A0A3Q0RGL3_AMPCI